MNLRLNRSSSFAVALLTSLALFGCSGTIHGGGDSNAQSPDTDNGSSTGTGTSCDGFMPTPVVMTAIAETAEQLGYTTCNPPISDGSGGGATTSTTSSSSSGGGCGIDPTTVYLEVASPSLTCGVPQNTSVCGTWSVSIGIPAARLVVGDIPLSDPSLIATFGELGQGTAGQCPGGGGSFGSGVLSITAVDASSVTFSLSGTQAFDLATGSADGDYVAQRCP